VERCTPNVPSGASKVQEITHDNPLAFAME